MEFDYSKQNKVLNITQLSEAIAEIQAQIKELQIKTNIHSKGDAMNRSVRAKPAMPMLVPELDYLVQVTIRRNEFRKGVYDGEGRVHMGNVPSGVTYGYYVEGNRGAEILISGPLLRKDTIETYKVAYKTDYRARKYRSVYMKGALTGHLEAGKEIADGTISAMVLEWSYPINKEIIDNTRNYWQSIDEREEDNRICNKDTMLRLCDLLEAGQLDAENIPWVVEQPRDSVTPDLLPLKITLPDDYMDEDLHPTLHKDDEEEDAWAALR